MLALSCKGRGFCPSCSTKHALLWGEFVQERVLRPVPHRHVIFMLPKMLRPIFRFHRELLPELCLCAWEATRDFFKASLSKDALPGAILTINIAGEFLQWQPHVHGLTTCGGFLPDGGFEHAPAIDAKTVRELFEAKVFSMLLDKGLIGHELLEKLRSWKHTGFDFWIGPELTNAKEIVQIGMYTARSSAAAGRLVIDDELGLKYFGKGTRPDVDIGSLFEPPSEKMDPLEWIARLTSHIPERGCQTTHYYAAYSNAHRGKQAKAGSSPGSEQTPTACAAESEDEWIRTRRRSWARLLQMVYECDPLLCECGGKLKIISVIETRNQSDVVGKILKHIKYQFEVLAIPGRAPPPSQPCLGFDWDDSPAAGACSAQ